MSYVSCKVHIHCTLHVSNRYYIYIYIYITQKGVIEKSIKQIYLSL